MSIKLSRRTGLQWWLRGLIPSMLIGAFISAVMRTSLQPRNLLSGAIIGICCMTLVAFIEVFLGRLLDRLPGLANRAIRGILYAIAGTLGFFIGLLISLRVVYGLPFQAALRELNFGPMLLIAASIAFVLGLVIYSYYHLKHRLEVSIERVKENEYAEKELELARSIQSRLLPPPESEGAGYRVAARNLAARFVAGDFYDIFHLGDGSVGLVVADVSGKGMGASLIMASVKAVLPLLAAGKSVDQTLTELNAKLSRELGKREFVALAYARFDPAGGRLQIANAGLPDPYILRRNALPSAVSAPGPRVPLGAMSNVRYEAAETSLNLGDRFLMFSDGLPEATTSPGEPLGYDALAKLFSGDGFSRSPGEWLDDLFARVRARTSEALEDDWTALLVERVQA